MRPEVPSSQFQVPGGPGTGRKISRRALIVGTGTVLASAAITPLGTWNFERGTSAQAAGPVTVMRSDAEVKFPTAVAFRLDAAAAPMSEINGVSLLYRPVGTPSWQRVHLPTAGGERVTLDYALDAQRNFLPPGIDVEYRWLFRLVGGEQVRTDIATFFYMDTRQQWRKIQNGQVTLWWYKGDDEFAKEAIESTVRGMNRMKQTLSATTNRPIRVLVYENPRDLRAALPQNSVEWTGGVNRPEFGVIHAVVAPGRGAPGEIRRVLPHEVGHQIAYQASENPYSTLPRWLDEGLAIRNQETSEVMYGPLLSDAFNRDKLIPLRALNSPFPFDTAQALLSYAESESIVNYIINDYRPGTVGSLVAAFRDGLSVDAAVQQVLKRPLDELERDWKEVLRSGGDQRPAPPIAGP